MRYQVLLILFQLVSYHLFGQLSEEWSDSKPTNLSYFFQSEPKLIFDNNSHLIVEGNQRIVKYTLGGNEIWSVDFVGVMGQHIEGRNNHIAIDSSDNIYVTGNTYNDSTFYDVVTTKYDSSGNLIWTDVYDNSQTDSTNELSGGLCLDQAGNLYVAITVSDSVTGQDYYLIKYDSSGNKVWERQNEINGEDRTHIVLCDNSGNVIIGGRSNTTNPQVFYLVKWDSSGNKQWDYTWFNSDYVHQLFYDMVIDGDNNIYMNGGDHELVKVRSNGTLAWHQSLWDTFYLSGEAYALRLDNNSNIVFTGRQYGDTTNGDVLVAKYDSSGNFLWWRLYQSNGNIYEQGSSIAFDNENNIYIVGQSGNTSSYDDLILKYSENGDLLFDFKRDRNYEDGLYSVLIGSSNEIYVAGNSSNGGNVEMVTTKYNQVTGIKIFSQTSAKLRAYPNPAQDNILLTFNDFKFPVSLDIYSIEGKHLQTINDIKQETTQLSIQELKPGIYIMKCSDADGNIYSDRLSKINCP